MTEISEKISNWSEEDLGNLAAILRIKNFDGSRESICNSFKWLYHSKSRAKIKNGAKNFKSFIVKSEKEDIESQYDLPSYENLLFEACRQMKVKVDESENLEKLEIYLSEAVIVEGLNKMAPEQRHSFFSSPVEPSSLYENVKYQDSSLKGPLRTTALIAAGNAAGFGLYTTATTALGLATHAVGVTLPFAAYTGLTSTIAFVIGPAGWMAVGFWGFLKITGAEWKSIIPALLYVASVNSYKKIAE